MKIKNLNFVLTCGFCPEQYDVYDSKNRLVGYVRLRYGFLTCEYPYIGGKCIYSRNIGDDLTGSFENSSQRKLHLTAIADKILKQINET